VSDHADTVHRHITASEPAMLDLLTRLIQANSENPPGRYDEVAAIYADALESIGFDTEILRVPDELVVEHGLSVPRLNVIGRKSSGKPGPVLMMNGHLDTVPIGETSEWTVDPLGGTVHSERVWGRGAVDSKGRLAAYWAAAAGVVAAGGPWQGDLLVVATCDEETGGDLGARWLMEEGGVTADYAIVEGYNTPVVRASSGILWIEIEVRGKASHASWPWRGHNAIVDAAVLVTQFEGLRAELEADRGDIPGIPHTTMSVGVMSGGTKVNVVPDRCVLHVDFRVMPGRSNAEILQRVAAILEGLRRERPGFQASLRVLQDQSPMVTPEDSELVQAVVQAVEDVAGFWPPIEGEPGGTDARWFNRHGVATVNYGPGTPDSGNFHAPDENVGLDQLREAAHVCGLVAARLLRA
jgi:succinyl-diaminopimelate desuccinylase